MSIDEDKLREFAEQNENSNDNIKEVSVSRIPTSGIDNKFQPVEIKSDREKKSEQYSFGNRLGWVEVLITDLPTKGLFYPADTRITIKAASAAEVRHWSTINTEEPSQLDDMLNYIIERCVTIKYANGVYSNWKDLKEVDRFYLLLAISELTFINGENKLQIKIGEGKVLDVKKDMIEYINFDEKLMKYYDEQDRCFNLKFKNGEVLKVSIPSLGITNWVKSYIINKQQQQQNFDTDFLTFAPFVITDWRGLNELSYEKHVVDSRNWSITRISALTKIKDEFLNAIDPKIKYLDEGGTELTAPINFLGGIKSIFIISDPFGELE